MTKNLPVTEDTARFSPARLPWHPAIEEKFGALGVDKSSWKALTEAVFPGAKSADSIVMALSYCAARKLDPFKRPVHIVPMWDNNRRQMVETVWPGISEIRTTAFRTSQYAGCDEVEFGEWTEKTISGKVGKRGEEREVTVVVRFPEWGRMTVYRMLNGQRCKFVSPKVYWLESYGRMGASDVPNDMWQKRPAGQLEKCVEAAALRKAFPEEIGNDYSAEEMHGQIITGTVPSVEIETAPPAPPPPPAPRQKDKARPTEKIEDAVIVEPEKPADLAPLSQDEPAFLYGDWMKHVAESFATCMTEQDVDETHDGFKDVVEERLTRNQAGEYEDLHEAALIRVTSGEHVEGVAASADEKPAEQEDEEAPAAPPPPSAAPAATKSAGPAADEDEEETVDLGAAYLARADASLADPNRTRESINGFWDDTKAERLKLKKDGHITTDALKAFHLRLTAEWEALGVADAGDQEETQKDEASDEITAFTEDLRQKIKACATVTELNAFYSSTLPTRNGFGLEQSDERVKAWKQIKTDRLAELNAVG